jgi:coenzyme F420-0:L-glutamate ligase / coenzyme F420-1:gamma-L-glutamate ligase
MAALGDVRIIPIRVEAEISPGDDLAGKLQAALQAQRLSIEPGDILVVKHKVVSKAEGQVVRLDRVSPSRAARAWSEQSGADPRMVELVLRESRRIVRRTKRILITETRHRLVCANSGVDLSNVDGGTSAVLLPKDSDRSAAGLRSRLRKLLGRDLAVIVSDSFGRPWREGLTEVALGVAGMKSWIDYRGRSDSHGYRLRTSQEALADEVACAAGLVCGKLERTPAAIVRGLRYRRGRGSGRDLIRPARNDLFR